MLKFGSVLGQQCRPNTKKLLCFLTKVGSNLRNLPLINWDQHDPYLMHCHVGSECWYRFTCGTIFLTPL